MQTCIDERTEPSAGSVSIAHEQLARSVARRYRGKGEPDEDVTQVAMVGLLKALRRFDPDRGTRFSTYAVATIEGELKRYFRDATWRLHVPRTDKDAAMRVRDWMEKAGASTGGNGSDLTDVARAAGVSLEGTRRAMAALRAYRMQSLDVSRDGRHSIHDGLGDRDEEIERVEDRETVRVLVAGLPDRERRLLRWRFVDEMTQSQIAYRMGISQMQVCRLLAQTLATLRQRLAIAA